MLVVAVIALGQGVKRGIEQGRCFGVRGKERVKINKKKSREMEFE